MNTSVSAVNQSDRKTLRPFFFPATLGALVAAWFFHAEASVLGLAILLFLVSLLPLIFRQRETDWLEMIYCYTALYGVHFGLRTIFLLYGEVAPYISLPRIDTESPYAAEGLVVAIVGLVTFLWGYCGGVGDRIAQRLPVVMTSRISKPSVLTGMIVIFVISLIGRLYLLATGKILAYDATRFTTEPWENFLGYASTFGMVAFALAIAYQLRNRKRLWLFWALIFPSEFFFWFLRGSRTSLLFAPLTFIILYHYLIRPLGARKIFLSFGGLFLGLMIMYPIHTAYRNVTHFGDVQLSSLGGDLERQFSAIQQERQNTPKDEGGSLLASQMIIEKFPVLEGLALTISFTEHWGYVWGQTLVMVPALWIPQVLWPSKNEFLHEANVLTGTILFERAEPGYGLSLGQVSEFYLNFGIAGVAAGMFAIGVLLRGFYFYCRRDALGDFGPVIYAVLWPHLVLSHAVPLFMTFGDGIRMIVLILFALFLMRVISLTRRLPADQCGLNAEPHFVPQVEVYGAKRVQGTTP